ncbi:MAG: rhodanese-like domain-containing protein [Gammaproteobacteria bacterium]|nr:rhodanese-like domain-containing protein [Gammaproteobacteria bacterium]
MKEKPSLSGLLIFISLLAVSSAQANDDVKDSVTPIEVNAAKEFVARHKNAVIMDVRTPVEYEMSHITGSVNVDVQDESFENMVIALDPNKTYIVHCTKNPADGRSNRALETLKSLGFKHLYTLEGGYVAWKDAELPLTEPSN